MAERRHSKASGAWDALAEEVVATDEERIRYWRNRSKIEGAHRLGEVYSRAADSHAIARKVVAARMRTHPSATTRLFSGTDSNPTLDTMVGAALATGIKMKLTFELAGPDDAPLEIVENF